MHGRAADMFSVDHESTKQEFSKMRQAAWDTNPRPEELFHWNTYTDRHLHAAW